MNSELVEMLNAEHSKNQKRLISEWIGLDMGRLKAVWKIVKTADEPLCNRAAWVISDVFDRDPWMLEQILEELVQHLLTHPSDPVRRNLSRTLAGLKLPEEHWGPLYDYGFKVTFDPTDAIAVRANCMEIISNIALKVPELIDELILAIEESYRFGSAGYKSRGKRTIHKLRKAQSKLGLSYN